MVKNVTVMIVAVASWALNNVVTAYHYSYVVLRRKREGSTCRAKTGVLLCASKMDPLGLKHCL